MSTHPISMHPTPQGRLLEFNHSAWQASFAEELAHVGGPRGHILRQLRTEVQHSTLDLLSLGEYRAANGAMISLPADRMIRAAAHAVSFNHWLPEPTYAPLRPPYGPTYFGDTAVHLFNRDILSVADDMRRLHPTDKIAILNMGCRTSPGGGWRRGCGAQEENLMRRTGLFRSIFSRDDEEAPLYPLPQWGGAYFPDVLVFRGPEEDGYQLLAHPFEVDIITVPAPRLVTRHRFRDPATLEMAISWIVDSMYWELQKQEVQHVVLSALGCGAYRNPPRLVADIMMDLLLSERHWGAFDSVTWAILDDHNSGTHGRPSNFAAFSAALTQRTGHRFPERPGTD